MPVTTPPTITALPTPPDPNDRSTFNSRAYPWSVAQQTLATEVGAVADNVFDNATDAAASAAAAAASAAAAVDASASAVGAANYVGPWASLTGALAIPASVTHAGSAWMLVSSVADVTAHTPGVSAQWLRTTSVDLVSGSTIKTVNGVSILGAGDLSTGAGDNYITATGGNGRGSTNTTVRRFAGWAQAGSAISYADSATLGATFTINETGIYSIVYRESTANATYFAVTKNSASLTTDPYSIPLADTIARNVGNSSAVNMVSAVERLTAGTVLRAQVPTSGNYDTAGYVQFMVRKVGL